MPSAPLLRKRGLINSRWDAFVRRTVSCRGLVHPIFYHGAPRAVACMIRKTLRLAEADQAKLDRIQAATGHTGFTQQIRSALTYATAYLEGWPKEGLIEAHAHQIRDLRGQITALQRRRRYERNLLSKHHVPIHAEDFESPSYEELQRGFQKVVQELNVEVARVAELEGELAKSGIAVGLVAHG